MKRLIPVFLTLIWTSSALAGVPVGTHTGYNPSVDSTSYNAYTVATLSTVVTKHMQPGAKITVLDGLPGSAPCAAAGFNLAIPTVARWTGSLWSCLDTISPVQFGAVASYNACEVTTVTSTTGTLSNCTPNATDFVNGSPIALARAGVTATIVAPTGLVVSPRTVSGATGSTVNTAVSYQVDVVDSAMGHSAVGGLAVASALYFTVGSGTGGAHTFTNTLINTPIAPSSLTVTATVSSAPITGTDNGSGTIAGTGVSGTINYSTGAISVTYTGFPDSATPITANYNSTGGLTTGNVIRDGGNYNTLAWHYVPLALGYQVFKCVGANCAVLHEAAFVPQPDAAVAPTWVYYADAGQDEASMSFTMGTGDGATKTFTNTLTAPVETGNITITTTVSALSVTATDNGSGTISGSGVTGTITYSSGAISVTYTTAPDNLAPINIVYTTAADMAAPASASRDWTLTTVTAGGGTASITWGTPVAVSNGTVLSITHDNTTPFEQAMTAATGRAAALYIPSGDFGYPEPLQMTDAQAFDTECTMYNDVSHGGRLIYQGENGLFGLRAHDTQHTESRCLSIDVSTTYGPAGGAAALSNTAMIVDGSNRHPAGGAIDTTYDHFLLVGGRWGVRQGLNFVDYTSGALCNTVANGIANAAQASCDSSQITWRQLYIHAGNAFLGGAQTPSAVGQIYESSNATQVSLNDNPEYVSVNVGWWNLLGSGNWRVFHPQCSMGNGASCLWVQSGNGGDIDGAEAEGPSPGISAWLVRVGSVSMVSAPLSLENTTVNQQITITVPGTIISKNNKSQFVNLATCTSAGGRILSEGDDLSNGWVTSNNCLVFSLMSRDNNSGADIIKGPKLILGGPGTGASGSGTPLTVIGTTHQTVPNVIVQSAGTQGADMMHFQNNTGVTMWGGFDPEGYLYAPTPVGATPVGTPGVPSEYLTLHDMNGQLVQVPAYNPTPAPTPP